MHHWLVLVVSLPRHPSSLRVRAWRRLKALGAVALKNGVYVLPATAGTTEQFQWLAQEVQRDGGDATLLIVARVENVTDEELVRRFHEARAADYRGLLTRYQRLLRTLDHTRPGGPHARTGDDAQRLARELARVRAIDYFDAPAGANVVRVKEAIEARLASPAAAPPIRLPAGAQGRAWVTRPRPHVDRMASAWFIRRFVDPDARFVFAPAEARPADAIPFDMVGAELGHHGDRCTFEILNQARGLRDSRLDAMAEIVHDADLGDEKFGRDEARGLDLAVRSLLAATPDDDQALSLGTTLFEGLYTTLGQDGSRRRHA